MSEMSPLDLANLILGIIGTGTGIIALLIHFFRLRWERPRLQGEIIECFHQFGTKNDGSTPAIFVKPTFKLTNLGDRGTNISDIHISFTVGHKRYSSKETVYIHLLTFEEIKDRRWIEAHEIVQVKPVFEIAYDGPLNDSIKCFFTLFHAHGKLTIKGNSKKKL